MKLRGRLACTDPDAPWKLARARGRSSSDLRMFNHWWCRPGPTGREQWCRRCGPSGSGPEPRSAQAGAPGLGRRAALELQAIAVCLLFGVIPTEQRARRVDQCSGSGQIQWKCSERRGGRGDGKDINNNVGRRRRPQAWRVLGVDRKRQGAGRRAAGSRGNVWGGKFEGGNTVQKGGGQ